MGSETSAARVELLKMINGYWLTQAVYVAAKLGIADLVAKEPKTVQAIAASCGTDEKSTYRLLRALASLGLFEEMEDGRFQSTPVGGLLRSDVPGSIRGVALYSGDPEHYRAWGELLYSVQTGERAFDRVFGKRVFDYMAEHPDVARTFDAAMTGYTVEVAGAIADNYDFSAIRKIVDVGGGAGTMLAQILEANPAMTGTLVDLPHVIERARGLLASRGLSGRCELVEGDFFQSVPAGGDAYILKWIIHDWEDERAIMILRNCRRAMSPSARLLLAEAVVPPGNAPDFAKLLDLNMLVMTGGLERSEDEWKKLLQASGFKMEGFQPVHPMVSIIEGRIDD